MFDTATGAILFYVLRYNVVQNLFHYKGGSMDTIGIYDSNQQIRFICEDLKAVQAVTTMAEDNEVLIVVRRALDPIISDLQKATNSIDEALRETKDSSD